MKPTPKIHIAPPIQILISEKTAYLTGDSFVWKSQRGFRCPKVTANSAISPVQKKMVSTTTRTRTFPVSSMMSAIIACSSRTPKLTGARGFPAPPVQRDVRPSWQPTGSDDASHRLSDSLQRGTLEIADVRRDQILIGREQFRRASVAGDLQRA